MQNARFLRPLRYLLLLSGCLPALLGAQALTTAELENTSWQLVEIRDINDTVYTPEDPSRYLLRFRLENRLQVEADCNQAGATWTLEDNTLSFTSLVSTRKFCTAPSLFNRYIMHLDRVSSIQREGDSLVLHSGAGAAAVELEFEPYVFVPQV